MKTKITVNIENTEKFKKLIIENTKQRKVLEALSRMIKSGHFNSIDAMKMIDLALKEERVNNA